MLPKAVEYSTPSRTLRASIQLSWIGGARIGGLGGRVRLHSRTRGGTRPDPGEKIDRAASAGRSARHRCDLRRCGREASATSPAGASRRRPQRVPPLFGDTRGRLVPQRCCRCRAGDQSGRPPEPDSKQVTEPVFPQPRHHGRLISNCCIIHRRERGVRARPLLVRPRPKNNEFRGCTALHCGCRAKHRLCFKYLVENSGSEKQRNLGFGNNEFEHG